MPPLPFLSPLLQSQVNLKNTLFYSSSSSFLCTYTHFPSCSATSPAIVNQNPNPSPSTNNKDDHHVSAMSIFLVEGLGLSHSQISTVKKIYPSLFRPTPNPLKRAQDVHRLFKEYGFTGSQIRLLVSRQPNILSLKADERLRPKLEMLTSLGFTRHGLGHVVSRGHRILTVKDLNSSIDYFRYLFHGDANLFKAVKRCAFLLGCNVNTASRQLSLLEQHGMPPDLIFNVACQVPHVLCASAEATQLRIQYFRDLGVSMDSKSFAMTLARSLSLSFKKMEEKMRILKMLGLSDKRVKEITGKHPLILFISSQKIMKIAEYLIQIGVPLDEALRSPAILGLSLEKRIKPRHDVFMFLNESSSFKRIPPLLYFLRMSEKMFLEKHVNNHPQRVKLLSLLGRENDASSITISRV